VPLEAMVSFNMQWSVPVGGQGDTCMRRQKGINPLLQAK
jgi:hypothetical protein